MRVYLSVDMEGIAGVNHPGPTASGHTRYPAAVDLMVGETNAAIEGALAAGAEDILVNDSHGGMFNLLPMGDPPCGARAAGPESVVDGRRCGAGRRVRCRPVRRLPRARRASARDHRPHLLAAPRRDAPGRTADRRVRPQRDDPRGVGHPGRPGRRRRRPGR